MTSTKCNIIIYHTLSGFLSGGGESIRPPPALGSLLPPPLELSNYHMYAVRVDRAMPPSTHQITYYRFGPNPERNPVNYRRRWLLSACAYSMWQQGNMRLTKNMRLIKRAKTW